MEKLKVILENRSEVKQVVSKMWNRLGRLATDLYILQRVARDHGEVGMEGLVLEIDESILLRELISKFARENDWERLRDFLGNDFEECFGE